MAGFFGNNRYRALKSKLVELSKLGARTDDLLIKNSQAIGFIEGQMMSSSGRMTSNDDLLRYSMALSDTTSQLSTKAIAFFQLDYITKRERLRDIASNGEIEFIIETITDDVVVPDEDNRFCRPKDLTGELRYKGRNQDQRLEFQDKVIKKYHDNFEKINFAWGFNEGISAWQYFYQFLIEGHLAFEILYDNLEKPKSIIGFKELDPATLWPQVNRDSKGKIFLQWVQQDPSDGSTRQLSDSQIIYISYSNQFRTKRVSFVERLIRSFNLLRIIEHSKVIWHTMNAPIRLKTTVPVGSKPINKAKEDVREFLNLLKEDIFFDTASGEMKVDGNAQPLFYKNYALPVNDKNEQIDISPLEYPGPNLSGSELLNYFMKKLKMDSKIPYSRWEGQSGMGAFTLNAEGISREEIRYNKFVNRLRTAFSEMITKPLYLQMCLDMPELKKDYRFKNSIGIVYHNDNIFEEIKESELLAKRLATLSAMKSVVDDTGKPYFSTEYLVREILKIPEDELEKNSNFFKAEAEEQAEAEGDPSDAVNAFGEAPQTGGDAGGGAAGGGAAPPPTGGGAAPPPPTGDAGGAGGGAAGGGETSSEAGEEGNL